VSSTRVLLSTAAKAQIRSIRLWWRRERTKAPSAFSDELREAFELLRRYPESGTAVVDEPFTGMRRLSLNRTHYYLYYEVAGADVIIAGIRHQSQV
jgi:plasmid stabilization system protein ParE